MHVINGVDPNPSDGVDESGSDIRGEQNIGRSGGVGVTGSAERSGRSTARRSTAARSTTCSAALLHANPFASTVG